MSPVGMSFGGMPPVGMPLVIETSLDYRPITSAAVVDGAILDEGRGTGKFGLTRLRSIGDTGHEGLPAGRGGRPERGLDPGGLATRDHGHRRWRQPGCGGTDRDDRSPRPPDRPARN